jgi:hypothetical protein
MLTVILKEIIFEKTYTTIIRIFLATEVRVPGGADLLKRSQKILHYHPFKKDT